MPKPVLLLAFANDRAEPGRELRNLPAEVRELRDRLDTEATSDLWDVVVEQNVTLDGLIRVFEDRRYADRITVFHFAGHAGSHALLLEDEQGAATTAHADGLAGLLAKQRQLQLVFLNGCSTLGQVEALLDADVPAVVATSSAIDDAVACEFAGRFYGFLAGGVSIQSAYEQARAAVRLRAGSSPRDLYAADAPPADHWPWDLHSRPGAEIGLEWNLGDAAGDPTFGLPPLPHHPDLPDKPFRYLEWFHPEHAELFFGRGAEIRDLYERVVATESPPITMLYGQSGVGKSSLLAAGLLPRLAASHVTRYVRRDSELGLERSLLRALGALDRASAQHAWAEIEREAGRPLIVILDQVEEVFTRPSKASPGEVSDFMALLGELFRNRATRPDGRLVLGFRKEWYSELDLQLAQAELPRSRVFLRRLGRAGSVEAVTGVSRSERLRQRYGATVEDGLAEIIADDLLEDPGSPVAPTLQVLLSKMWDEATEASPSEPVFSRDLYQQLRRDGILLSDFLDQRLAELAQWNPDVAESGFLLDFLAFHTSELGAAVARTTTEVAERYPHRAEILPALRERCKDAFLLVEPGGEDRSSEVRVSRLAHDTLGPLVRERFQASSAPGQHARRILEGRVVGWTDGAVGDPLDDTDLDAVEAGAEGMRAFSPDELRLVTASKFERARRRRLRRRLTLGVAAVVAALSIALTIVGVRARRDALKLIATSILTIAAGQEDPLLGTLLLAELADDPPPDNGAVQALSIVQRAVPLAVLEGHEDEVQSAAFSPDGTRIVTASSDGTARVFDADGSGEPIVLEGHENVVQSAAFSPDGTRIVTASSDGTARVFDADGSGEPIVLEGHENVVQSAAFSPDGNRIVTASYDGTARVFNADGSGEPIVLEGHENVVQSAAFSPDGTRIVTASRDGTARVFDADGSGEPIVLEGHENEVQSAAFSPDGTRIVTASWDGTARVFDADGSGEPTLLEGHAGAVVSAAFSPDGTRIVTASGDRTARVFDADGSVEPIVLEGHESFVLSAAFSPDGTHIVTASPDGTARVFNADGSGEPIVLEGHENEVLSAAFSPDGTRIVTASSDRTARVFNADGSGEPIVLEGHENEVLSAAFSPDGTHIVTASPDGTARVFNADGSGEPIVLEGHEDVVLSAAFSPDGTHIVTASPDGTARVFNADGSGEPIVLEGHEDVVLSAAFSPDGTRIVTASSDRTARVFNADGSGEPIVLEGHENVVQSAAFSPDGTRIVTASWDRTARVFNADGSGEPIVLEGHTDSVESAAFSPDGTRIVTASYDGTARVFNADGSGEPIVLEGHTDVVQSAAFSPDGTRIVTASRDGTARVFDADGSGEPIVLEGHENVVLSAAFSPDGTRIVTASSDRTARVFNADGSGEPIVLEGHENEVLSAAFSPDGTRIVTASWDGTARVWRVSWEALVEYARSATTACLSVSDRRRFLGESDRQAAGRFEACEGRNGR